MLKLSCLRSSGYIVLINEMNKIVRYFKNISARHSNIGRNNRRDFSLRDNGAFGVGVDRQLKVGRGDRKRLMVSKGF